MEARDRSQEGKGRTELSDNRKGRIIAEATGI